MRRIQVYACVVTIIILSWAVLVGMVPPMSAGQRISEDFESIPKHVEGWDGVNQSFDQGVYGILKTCSILQRIYRNGSGENVALSIVYGLDLGDFHQPEICMQGSGWKTMSRKTIWLSPKNEEKHKATVVRLSNDLDSDIVMIYWFYMNGEICASMEKQGALMSVIRGGELKPSAMVKFTTSIDVDEETAIKSASTLSELLGKSIVDMAKKKPKFVPSDQSEP